MRQVTVRALVLLEVEGDEVGGFWGAGNLGSIDDLSLTGKDGECTRLLISMSARAACDGRPAAGGGVSGGCSQRLLWTSDIKRCEAVRSQLRRQPDRIDWLLSMRAGRFDDIRIGARVDGVGRLPASWEEAFGFAS